jgi:HK97 gp10 family phage protein
MPYGSGEVVTVEVSGLEELQNSLTELPERLAKVGIRRALAQGAKIFQAGIFTLARVIKVGTPAAPVGFLREHFGWRISANRGDPLAAWAYIGPQGKIDYPDADGGYREKNKKNGKMAKIGRIAVASVARFLEFGTSKLPAKPFMETAFEQYKNMVLDEVIRILAGEVEAAASGNKQFTGAAGPQATATQLKG